MAKKTTPTTLNVGDEVVGYEELHEKLVALGDRAGELSQKALYQVAMLVRNLSMEMTPVDTGTLKGSHEMPEVGTDDDGAFARLKVGGPAAPYALIVHERLDVNHEVGAAKFLEYALLAYKDDLPSLLAERIDLAEAAEGLG